MQKIMLGFLGFAFIFALAIPSGFRAQMQSPSPHLPRGTATDISNSEIDALVRKVAERNNGRYLGVPTSVPIEQAIFGPRARAPGEP